MCAQKLTDACLIYRTEPKTKTRKVKKLKNKMDMLRRNGAGPETVESVRRGGRKSRVQMICGTGRF